MKKSCKIKFKILIIIVLIFTIFLWSYINSTALIIESAGTKYESIISNCGYFALEKTIDEKFDFSKVCNIMKNEKGDITFINTDTLLVNYLCKNLALLCYDFTQKEVEKGFDVPIGAFTGIKLFSGIGPTVNVNLLTVVSTQCNLKRSFESVGVNQTRQVLSVTIDTDLDVFSGIKSKNYKGSIEINLFDNLIIGKIPEIYLNNQIIGSSSAG